MKSLVLLALAACGDHLGPAAADAARTTDAPNGACSATLTGNVEEVTTSDQLCPSLTPGAGASMGHTMLHFVVASRVLATNLAITIDLGARPTTTVYSAENTPIWTALAIETAPVDGACVFTAGASSVPAGSFALQLDAIDAATGTSHGRLALLMFVLPRTTEQGMQTDCGAGTTESVAIRF
ncbi:MAG: hypothetical protein ABI467_30200 [Kofleriaceae bacterium]